MKRLDTKSLPPFLKSASVAVVFFGAEDGESTMRQAEEFALLWADVVTSDLAGVRFGYVDGTANWQARDLFGVDKLPTTLIIRNGAVTHSFEDVPACGEITLALHRPRRASGHSGAGWRRNREIDAIRQPSAA